MARVCVVALAVALSGCSSLEAQEPSRATSGAGAPALSAVLYQSRMDLDDRQVQVRVSNDGDRDVVVERMSLVSTAFDAPMVYRKSGSTLQAGRVVDMPVVLSEPVCGEGEGQHAVRVDYRFEDGVTGTAEIPAVDQRGVVADLHAAECFALDVGRVATLSVSGEPRLVHHDGVLTAELVVEVAAADERKGDLRILRMGNTTLLQHVEPTTLERLHEGLAVDVRAPEEGARSFTATLVPGRCDAHAVAEDKQGTRFRLLVELDGTQGQVVLGVTDAVKVALYEFVREACARSTGAGT